MSVSLPTSSRPRELPATPAGPLTTTDRAPFNVIAVNDFDLLESYLKSWDDLAAAAVEPNVFYESWMLLPALRNYGKNGVTVLLVFSNLAPHRHGKPLLCGLFPLIRQRRGIIPVLCLWQNIHCYLAVPLIRSGFGAGVLQALFDWLAHARGGAPVLECGSISGDGPFYHLLLDFVRDHCRGLFLVDAYARALLRQDGRPLSNGLSGEKRKKLRRAEQRLAATASIEYSALPAGGDVNAWLSEFLRLEASGWKNRAGTALSCRDTDRQYFLDVARASFERGRLMMLSLNVGGRPIAQLCNFIAGEGSFAFKVAFDEAYACYSPGALLELENLRRVEAMPELKWMDSCTGAGDPLIKHLWADRRIIQTVVIETGRASGPLILATLPLWRWLRRGLGAAVGSKKAASS